MKLSTLLLSFVLLLPLVATAQLDQPHARLQVTFSQPVTVNKDKVLPPGQYNLEQIRTQAQQQNPFRIEDPSGKQLGFTVTPVKAVWVNWEGAAGQVPESNMVMIKKVGDAAYLDYIWFQGEPEGYHFVLAPKGAQGEEINVLKGK